MPMLLLTFRGTFAGDRPERFEQMLDLLCRCEHLVLDDLGRERPTEWDGIVVPETAMSGSPTPNASTRFRMFSSACCITSSGVPSGADRITDAPPCRSRPSVGRRSPRKVRGAATVTSNAGSAAISRTIPRFRATT